MIAPSTAQAGLQARGLECVRGERTLFRNLDVEAFGGELVHIVGPNGCGKTSLLRLLSGLLPPAAGRVTWRGRDIDDERAAFHRDALFVGHLDGLKGDLSARENLEFSAGIAGGDTRLVDDAIAAMGLPRRIRHARARTLSAGQRRRVALARVLLSKAPLWLLDEPLTALDSETRTIVEGMFKDHLDNRGIIVLSSHASLESSGLATRRRELRL